MAGIVSMYMYLWSFNIKTSVYPKQGLFAFPSVRIKLKILILEKMLLWMHELHCIHNILDNLEWSQ